jgi:biotin transport system substrate-specific component
LLRTLKQLRFACWSPKHLTIQNGQGKQMSNTLLANRIWPEATSSNLVRNIVLAVAGSLFVAAAAQVALPIGPVPITLQSLAVLLVGGVYGSRLGAATLGLYALEGAIGLPFFAGAKSGLGDAKLDYFLPAASMGFVLGFIAAAWVVGKLIESGWGRSLAKSVLATVIGAVVLYVPGLIWLGIWAAKTKGMDASAAAQAALSWGLYPFIVSDLVKAVIAGLVPGAAVGFGRKG